MLEHTDRDDAVVTVRFLAIVAQVKADAVSKTGRGGAALCDLELLRGQGEPGDVNAAFARQVQREPAPTRADVEHFHARAQQQLGRDMPTLVELRGVDIVV